MIGYIPPYVEPWWKWARDILPWFSAFALIMLALLFFSIFLNWKQMSGGKKNGN